MSLDSNEIRNKVFQKLLVNNVLPIHTIAYELSVEYGFGELNGNYLEALEWPVEITIVDGVFHYVPAEESI